ncbi:phosphonate transport system permease protein [Paracoccus isoporae]|uniref:Phosphonate transport system permease protein n=1 Tax=Paracoccus isoporae TaxID=591205 RepID=A0A1G6U4U5_9RHOB|nr:phosphonate transport system permease protein [Paracoccus isoporae]
MAMAEINQAVHAGFSRKRAFSLAVPAAVLAYLIYVAIAFDLAGLAARARWDNGALLLQDFWSYKTHVTR